MNEGEGLHHISYHVRDLAKELKKTEKLGIKILETSTIYGITHAYLDTRKQCGFILEISQRPGK